MESITDVIDQINSGIILVYFDPINLLSDHARICWAGALG